MLDAVFGSTNVKHNKMELNHDDKDHNKIAGLSCYSHSQLNIFLIMHNITFDRREKLFRPQKPTVQKSNDLNSIKHGKNVLYGKNEVAINIFAWTVLYNLKFYPID